MFTSTLPSLRCPCRLPKKGQPLCNSSLTLLPGAKLKDKDILTGELACSSCKGRFPILAGVALLVSDVREYLLFHVKGISSLIANSEIPKIYRGDFLEAKAELEEMGTEHIEEDLESERVTSLYLMNHFLRTKKTAEKDIWWKDGSGNPSPLIDEIMRKYWDQGPFFKIREWVKALHQKGKPIRTLELGCGTGGLALEVGPHSDFFLGVDSSFRSIALGRHFVFGAPYSRPIGMPGDLIQGPSEIPFPKAQGPFLPSQKGDLIVGDMEALPVSQGDWDLTIALNAIDMLGDPTVLPPIHKKLASPGGAVIQSCPYIWHKDSAKKIRNILPKAIKDSATAVEWLYEKSGCKIEERVTHWPWLFLKHPRQIEIYSVHLFLAKF